MPLSTVSVVIPTYQRAHLIGRAVRSVLAAVSPGDEVIIADDGSTDDTVAAVAPFGDRVRFLALPHAGAGATRNAGIRAATRDLVAFLDSDDEWDADKLSIMRPLLDARPDVLFCFSDFRVQELDGSLHPKYLIRWRPDDPRSWEEILGEPQMYSSFVPVSRERQDFKIYTGSMYKPLMESPFIPTSTLVVRREQAGDELRFAEDVPTFEDLECFTRIARLGQAAYLDIETATQHAHVGPRLTDANGEKQTRSMLILLDRLWGQDADYLQQHREQFLRTVQDQHLRRARCLIVEGRNTEARKELELAGPAPMSYRFLAALPGFVTRGLLRLRRVVRGSA